MRQKQTYNYKTNAVRFPGGFFSWLIYQISEYRYQNENWDCIFKGQRPDSPRYSKIYQKIKQSPRVAQKKESFEYRGVDTIHSTQFVTIIDDYSITAEVLYPGSDHLNITYKLIISDDQDHEKLLTGGKFAKKIYLLLKNKQKTER